MSDIPFGPLLDIVLGLSIVLCTLLNFDVLLETVESAESIKAKIASGSWKKRTIKTVFLVLGAGLMILGIASLFRA